MQKVIEDKESYTLKELNFKFYKKMYLIRKAEENIRMYYNEDEMKTPVHLCIGEEAIAVGVCSALNPNDQVFGTYRSHGIYLAKTTETDKFFAELYGKATGVVKGKVGSMHLSAPETGFLGTSAIVGGIIPIALGAAFANKMKRNGKLVAAFFGDGAIDEGAFWESLNTACLMKLPILFVCEDNDFAVYTHKSLRHGYKSITDIVSQFNCNVFQEKSTDVEVIYQLVSKAKKSIEETQKPCFLHLHYYRYLEHVGVNEDFECGHRSREDFEKWCIVDPIKMQREKLLKLGISEEDIYKEECNINSQIEKSIRLAKNAPLCDNNELCKGVYNI